ncbi:MAG: hypothetical protein QOH12_3476 [Solirubrobacteraceae bacterium]|nr:hypothetical protein [Solirubrobacteraceae bacterium]
MVRRASIPSSALMPAGPEAFPNSIVFAGPPGTGAVRGSLESRPARPVPGVPISRTTAGLAGVDLVPGEVGLRALVWLMKKWTPGTLISRVELTGTGAFAA